MLILTLCLMVPQVVWANTQEAELDAVLVIDASLSMQTTDPNKLGLEAVKMFIDMLGMTDNQVGIVTYCKTVDRTYPITTVKSQPDKEAMKKFTDSIKRNLNFTDITSGLMEANKMLDGRAQLGNEPLIVVFTDGNNDIRGLEGRTEEDIASDLEQIIGHAKGNTYPIYTVGLNHNGGLNAGYLENISSQTGGKSFVTSDPSELPSILTQIFAEHLKLTVTNLAQLVATGEYEEIKVNIPNANVLEANISATSSQPVNFRLVNPQGVEIGIPSSSVSLHESNTYSLLKLMKPEEGDWKLYVKGVKGDQINIDLVYNYEMGVTLEKLGQRQYGVQEEMPVSAYLSVNGAAILDEALYKDTKGYLMMRDLRTGIEQSIPLNTLVEGFEGKLMLKETGDFDVWVKVEGDGFMRESDKQTITVGAAVVTHPPTNTPDVAEPVEKEEPLKILRNILIGVGLLIALAGLGGVGIIIKRSQKPLVGQVVIEVRDQGSGKLSPPQYKKLHVFKGKVSLHALLQFAPEFKMIEAICLKSAPHDQVVLINPTAYAVIKSGRTLAPKEPLVLRVGDKIAIEVPDAGYTIYMEYLL